MLLEEVFTMKSQVVIAMKNQTLISSELHRCRSDQWDLIRSFLKNLRKKSELTVLDLFFSTAVCGDEEDPTVVQARVRNGSDRHLQILWRPSLSIVDIEHIREEWRNHTFSSYKWVLVYTMMQFGLRYKPPNIGLSCNWTLNPII